MRYLTITADYQGSGISDDFAGEITPASLGLSQHLSKRIEEWVLKYQPIIPLDEEQRRLRLEEIERLDEEGIGLMQEVKTELGDAVKLSYYSEGKLRKVSW
jgi:hypothetical protein